VIWVPDSDTDQPCGFVLLAITAPEPSTMSQFGSAGAAEPFDANVLQPASGTKLEDVCTTDAAAAADTAARIAADRAFAVAYPCGKARPRCSEVPASAEDLLPTTTCTPRLAADTTSVPRLWRPPDSTKRPVWTTAGVKPRAPLADVAMGRRFCGDG
jgi:hypothetical protein